MSEVKVLPELSAKLWDEISVCFFLSLTFMGAEKIQHVKCTKRWLYCLCLRTVHKIVSRGSCLTLGKPLRGLSISSWASYLPIWRSKMYAAGICSVFISIRSSQSCLFLWMAAWGLSTSTALLLHWNHSDERIPEGSSSIAAWVWLIFFVFLE